MYQLKLYKKYNKKNLKKKKIKGLALRRINKIYYRIIFKYILQ